MINIEGAYMFCRDDISLIENYYEAILDRSELWVCHHKDEIRCLPSGMTVRRSVQDLKDNGRYYNCPANELIFMRVSEHMRLHSAGRIYTKETREKLSKNAYKQWDRQGRVGPKTRVTNSTDEYRKLLSDRLKGVHKGWHWKVVEGKRMWYV